MYELDFNMFKGIIRNIKAEEEKNRRLTDILIDQSTGLCDIGHETRQNLIELVAKMLNDTDGLLEWWLYDDIAEVKDKLIKIDNVEYNVTDIKDLYHFLKGEYNLVKIHK